MNLDVFLLSSAVILPNPAETDGCPTWLVIVAIVIILFYADQQSQSENKTNKKRKSEYIDSKTSTKYSSPIRTHYRRNIDDVYPPFDEEIDEILSQRDQTLWQEKNQNNTTKQSQFYHPNSLQVTQKSSPVPITTEPVNYLSIDLQNQETISENRKNDWRSFDIIIRKNHIEYLYHFTDAKNLASIIEYGGLFSWRSCLEKGIRIPCPGGNSLSRLLDYHKDLDDYIHLGFNREHPMLFVAKNEGRILRPVILRIDPSVILWKSTCFSDRNAASSQARIGGTFNDFCCIDFSIACGPTWNGPNEKSAFQAEVLVLSHIPLELIYF